MTASVTLARFQAVRPRLFGIAYRMLGTVTDAEDVLQDAWLRWQRADPAAVEDDAAFLSTVVTRLCLTALDSARVRRESYVGPWLPEPVSTAADPLLGAERAEALSLAVLLLLERLTPAERAAYVLHEAFDYPFARIAETIGVSEANARQLGSRARAHVLRERATPVDGATHERLLRAFVAAARQGDLAALEAALAGDAVSVSDGGGVVPAARRIVGGSARVARFLLGVLEKLGADLQQHELPVNGGTATLGTRDGIPIALWSIELGAAGVRRVLIVLNPDKLRWIGTAMSHP